ncbi:hypothetical protein [Bartonella tamiae]|uniref:hypothetical protein n=1 Tax=Bartonella tamiae TaxID=373638 RepID=UPI001FDA202E|nr:hypothetical protein [Bartonella tamiae]
MTVGKWLSALKKIKNGENPNPPNPQNYQKGGFDGFEGSEYEQKQKKNNGGYLYDDGGDRLHDDEQRDQIEEQAAILEYDGGYSRDEAERIAGMKTSAPMLKNVETSKRPKHSLANENDDSFPTRKKGEPIPVIIYDMKAKPDDDETYLKALQLHGAMSYGMAMRVLGWGGTRAANAEDRLRETGRIAYNKQGRAVVVDKDTSGKAVA